MTKQVLTAAIILSAAIFFNSCELINDELKPSKGKYAIEWINENNFFSKEWREQQVNNVSGNQIFSDESEHVEIVCGPENNSNPRLMEGSVTMNLPTSEDPTLRRVRLRRVGYNGTRLADLTELKYSTYVIQQSPTIMVLQVDLDNDGDRDGNIFYNPLEYFQGEAYIPIVYNTWQQWDALHNGVWHIELMELPEFPDNIVTIQELISIPAYADARIIDTPPVGHEGEGVRFTIGGNPRELFDNTIVYFDA
ncbi:hypothetical protein ACFS7Z_23430 [Pontibacter toksunensis]|uniref:Uncharacterized protein n=1 Tax=Pontibacter toksunensis TaxID=1332631 RepID=A0ABW6C1P7_9BACT